MTLGGGGGGGGGLRSVRVQGCVGYKEGRGARRERVQLPEQPEDETVLQSAGPRPGDSAVSSLMAAD